ncbi:MAG: cell division protein ZapA [Desulfovibrio sp.]|nr:cell division protein ZapA [Desulfovibrio sp.]MBD5647432.1 cell division protein ZapA [Desulfovibrio sp.]
MTASSRLFVSDTNINLTVLGFDIAFRAGADMERAQETARLVEERFALLKSRSQGGQNRELLLTFLALGLADELLQLEKKQNDARRRIAALLARIENSE